MHEESDSVRSMRSMRGLTAEKGVRHAEKAGAKKMGNTKPDEPSRMNLLTGSSKLLKRRKRRK
jgi:hypothetical protein